VSSFASPSNHGAMPSANANDDHDDGARHLFTQDVGFPLADLVVVLDLEKSNRSQTKCSMVNSQLLCTAIDSCPLSAYQCEYVNEDGYSCGFNNPECRCSASWGNRTCDCYVEPAGKPYLVAAAVQCPLGTNDDDAGVGLEVSSLWGSSCLDGADRGGDGVEFCTFSTSGLDLTYVDNLQRMLEVRLDCRTDPDFAATHNYGYCSCSAWYNYEPCSHCHVCDFGDPGSYSLECPGYSAACDGSHAVWQYQRSSSPPPAVAGWPLCLLLSVAAMVASAAITTEQF